jgi:predicted acylesterase/phospholipase RssA
MADATGEYCDLVMKGGLTSGIVYPGAVLELAKRYRFKNIGGTSVGAIAAAAVAAAALGQRRKDLAPGALPAGAKGTGLDGLARVAEDLKRKGFIFALFQPAPRARAVFALATRLIGKPGPVGATLAVVRAILRLAPFWTLAFVASFAGIAWLVGGTRGLLAAGFPALLCALAGGAIAALFRTGRALRGNAFGLCPGISQSKGPALMEWLDQILQSLSGQTGRPLLFDDLLAGPLYPGEPGKEAIDLRMITTGVSHHEPRSLPFQDGRFWFRRDELERLFPKAVVEWMAAQDKAPVRAGGHVYHRLPSGGRLPVLVATRMSLSFPILISAIPLHEGVFGDTEAASRPTDSSTRTSPLRAAEALAAGGDAPARGVPAHFRRCWFSDGGISSNFPIHLFDAALPRWPTFAIDLVYPDTAPGGTPPQVFLPKGNQEGWRPRYQAIESRSGIGEVARLLFAIIGTMQNWRDLLQSRAPGHRDRIVHVPLSADQGGFNLDMPQEVLDAIAVKGAEAGRILRDQFDFNNHWWVRWRNVAASVENFTVGVAGSAGAPPTPSYAYAWNSARSGAPAAPSYKFTKNQQAEASVRLAAMIQLGNDWKASATKLAVKAPKPLPQLRIVPTF